MIKVFKHILKRIEDSPIEHVPFPHLVIAEIFPADFYSDLLQALPKADQFVSAKYPGTGFGKAKSGEGNSSGLVFPDISGVPLLGELKKFLRGDEFCRALLNKFSIAAGIPREKYRHFADGARDFTSVFDLQIDRRGYEILPHADVASKIVTFQFYLAQDDSLKEFGTLFCRTKNGQAARRTFAAKAVGSTAESCAKLLHGWPDSFWYRFERTRLGTEIGFGDSKNWYPWRLFDIVAAAPALPNHFMAFAPNDRSYHAVRMNLPESAEGRRVIRGFIRSSVDQKNFITLEKPAASHPRAS